MIKGRYILSQCLSCHLPEEAKSSLISSALVSQRAPEPSRIVLLLMTMKAVFSLCSGRVTAQPYLNGERGITNADFFLCQVHVAGVLISQHSRQPEQMVLSQLFSKPCVRHRDLQVVDWNRVVK